MQGPRRKKIGFEKGKGRRKTPERKVERTEGESASCLAERLISGSEHVRRGGVNPDGVGGRDPPNFGQGSWGRRVVVGVVKYYYIL